MSIPQQKDADLDDPKQRFVWAFQGIQFKGSPMAFPQPILEAWSEHLSKAGFIHVSQAERALISMDSGGNGYDMLPKQEIQYQPPVRGQDHSMNISGQWIPIEQEVKQPIVPTASLMTAQEKAKMIQEFKEEGLID